MYRLPSGKVIDLLEAQAGELVIDLELVSIRDDENDQVRPGSIVFPSIVTMTPPRRTYVLVVLLQGYYEDVPVSQEEVRQLVLKSLQADSPELMDRMKSSTPSGLGKP